MDRRQQDTRAQSNWASSHVSKPRRRSRHSAKGARAERDDKRRFHQGKLPVQPPAAVIDLARARRLVNAPLSTRDELEMLDRIREIALAFRETRLTQSRAQEPARRSDKRTTLKILLIPGLLADEDRTRTGWTFAEDCLRRAIAKRTEATSFRLAQERLVCVGGLLEPSGFGEASGDSGSPRVDLRWRRRDHLCCARSSGRCHRRDLARFGKIGPIFLWHLLEHGPLHQPRGIEDRPVVDVPCAGEIVERRRILASRARTEAQSPIPEN